MAALAGKGEDSISEGGFFSEKANGVEAGLRALLQGRLLDSQRILEAARRQAEDRENADPVIPALGLALGPVIESLISGSNESVKHAIKACDECLDKDVANQRAKYQSVIDNALGSIPVAGSVVSMLWSPVQSTMEAVTDLANITDSAERESHLDCASGVEGLIRTAKAMMLFLTGHIATGILELRSAYRAFLSISETTVSEWARDCRCLGLGNFAVVLSYVEPAFAATFNAVSLSFGMTKEEGMQLLRTASDRCTISYNIPNVIANVSLTVLRLVDHAQLAGSTDKHTQLTALTDARGILQTLLDVDPENLLGNWVLSHILRRKSEFDEATNVMKAVFDNIAVVYEQNAQVAPNRGGMPVAAAKQLEHSNRIAFRIRFELAQCHIIRLEYKQAMMIMGPLVDDASDYTAKGMALMLSGGVNACMGNHSESIKMFEKVLALGDSNSDNPVGQMDKVLMRKASVNVERSEIASVLSMHEMNYFLGYTAIVGKEILEHVLKDLMKTLALIQEKYDSDGSKDFKQGTSVGASCKHFSNCEELLAALFLTGTVSSYLCLDDLAEQHLTQVIKLASQLPENMNLSDPYYVPFAQYELGLIYLRDGKSVEAVDLFERSRKATRYTFDKALWYRSQAPYHRAKQMASRDE